MVNNATNSMKYIVGQTIPNLLRRYRKARGLNQKQAAAILGVGSTCTVSRWEKGACLPSLLNALKLAAVYRTMADALFPNLATILRQELLKREEGFLKERCAKAS
jgi:transcriptional regulator with XRE-family HTH domain